ncbi:trypsin-like peptidase domain-containing protein [Sanyastnella coralliicola]|uniref:trypsin-like peptidase domain-containing protein n=1 Tax=Sanyastnella coralliicola TaxID=3069118 RepID=UPI0027BA310C|nr:trypsin-like peptidase domain-containing protein [Longitalea sp. SCSIO 12813]
MTTLKPLLKLALCACLMLLYTQGFAQISQGGSPATFENNKINWHVPVMEMPPFDVDAMLAEDEINNEFKDAPYRFGKNFVLGRNLNNSGQWHELPNGDRVWLLKLTSPGAHSLNLSFDIFKIPEGGEVFVYSADHLHILGAFTSENNRDDLGFGTYPIPSDEIIVEYREPANQIGTGELQIETLTHAYRDLDVVARGIGDSGACNNNVICPVSAGWEDQINSVAMIVVNGNGICTGALVNNTANDGHPYFLTANHCLGGSVASWVFRFNWQSTTCSGNNVGAFDTVSGSTLLSSGAGTDYALLEINNGNPVPTAYNPFYAGWDATGNFPSNQVAIHHPSGDLKKISFDTDAAGQATFGGAQCWRIFDWEDGTTEPGSSGSPLFDQNQRIIGQLYGGQASCSNNVNDYYGRFDLTFPSICTYLAPGCSNTVIDGYDPNAPSVALDAQLLNVVEPDGIYCTSNVTPEVTVRNAGTTTLTSFTIEYQVDGGATMSQAWSGALASGNTVNVTLPQQTLADGAHTFNASVVNPNGGTDENNTNDSGSSSFSTAGTGITIDFDITTDNYPGETTWDLRDDQGTILFSDGPYAATQTTYSYSYCLPEGCYQLNVYDSFGDGLQYQGVIGDYILVDEFGTTHAQMVAGGNFGAQATHDFCLTLPGIPGCTDATACNYDPAATTDDGSCILPNGCTDASACNYDPAATCDDGSCTFPSMTFYVDGDSDGFGAGAAVLLCGPEAGYSAVNTDCDDMNGNVYPGAPGTGEDIDNNCDGNIDGDELSACPGDMNGDGNRDIADLLMMLADYGCVGGCTGDLDGDGNTSSSDFLTFLSFFGTPCN